MLLPDAAYLVALAAAFGRAVDERHRELAACVPGAALFSPFVAPPARPRTGVISRGSAR